jgi:hypothetical protein
MKIRWHRLFPHAVSVVPPVSGQLARPGAEQPRCRAQSLVVPSDRFVRRVRSPDRRGLSALHGGVD